MRIDHDNPTRPRTYQKKRNNRPVGPRYEVEARAPYNFVPLPDRTIHARELLPHDRYHPQAFSGRIRCDLETRSPTYVRGMLTEAQYKTQGRKKSDELTVTEKELRAPFFSIGEGESDNPGTPLIPGSSVRGMIRQLVEIIGYGRTRLVADSPTFTFRAVAAPDEDPLKRTYQQMLGKYGKEVRVGYLLREDETWCVQPAQTPKMTGWSNNNRDKWIKVVEEDVASGSLPGFLPFSANDYTPQVHDVSFERGPRVPKTDWQRGAPDRPSIHVGKPGEHLFDGVLVTSGNMAETGGTINRKNHIIILPPDQKSTPIPIGEEVVDAYLKGLTPFQQNYLSHWSSSGKGVLSTGKPVFFVEREGKVACFGHCPNFRIPAQLYGEARAANPRDFVPEALRNDRQPDLADAIFGWIDEEGSPRPEWEEGDKKHTVTQYAGRVFFEDAFFVNAKQGVWYSQDVTIPQVLAGPKPTTFQHYLVQNADFGHDPDHKSRLANYGTPRNETQVRGYKLYWHKGESPPFVASDLKRDEETGAYANESQLTRIRPLNSGVRFCFDIHFEDLRSEELGALLWALALPGDADKTYLHKLGMGKPLGLGAVKISPTLFLSQRVERYEKLFCENTWHQPGDSESIDMQPYLDAFTEFVSQRLGDDEKDFASLDRVQTLLTLLQWREGTSDWLDSTRYMSIELEVATGETINWTFDKRIGQARVKS